MATYIVQVSSIRDQTKQKGFNHTTFDLQLDADSPAQVREFLERVVNGVNISAPQPVQTQAPFVSPTQAQMNALFGGDLSEFDEDTSLPRCPDHDWPMKKIKTPYVVHGSRNRGRIAIWSCDACFKSGRVQQWKADKDLNIFDIEDKDGVIP